LDLENGLIQVWVFSAVSFANRVTMTTPIKMPTSRSAIVNPAKTAVDMGCAVVVVVEGAGVFVEVELSDGRMTRYPIICSEPGLELLLLKNSKMPGWLA
jgi:hypothetical protein